MPDLCPHDSFSAKAGVHRDILDGVLSLTSRLVVTCDKCQRRFVPASVNEFGEVELKPLDGKPL